MTNLWSKQHQRGPELMLNTTEDGCAGDIIFQIAGMALLIIIPKTLTAHSEKIFAAAAEHQQQVDYMDATVPPVVSLFSGQFRTMHLFCCSSSRCPTNRNGYSGHVDRG